MPFTQSATREVQNLSLGDPIPLWSSFRRVVPGRFRRPSPLASATALRHPDTSSANYLLHFRIAICYEHYRQGQTSESSAQRAGSDERFVKIRHTTATSHVRRRLNQNLAVAAVSVLVWQEIHIFPMVSSDCRLSLRGLPHDCGLL